MLGYLIFAVHNLLSLSMLWFATNRCLEPKYCRRTTILLEACGLALCGIIALLAKSFPLVESLRPFAMIAVFCSFAVILFQNRFFRKLLVMFCIFCSIVVSELLLYLLFPSITLELSQRKFSMLAVWWYLSFLVCEAIYLFFICRLFHKKSSDDMEQLPARQYWFFLFFPISQYALLTGYFFSIADNISTLTSFLIIICALVCFVADFIWFREIRRLSDNVRLKAENDLLGKQIEAQREYYKTLTANYADMATLRHDIANHIFTIRVLLLDGKSDEAMQYATQLEQNPAARSILSACKNSVVHSFLLHRLEELNEKDISSSFDVALAPVAGIPDTDLIIALGNLLDNAAEACAAAQERRIRLTVRQTDGYIHIETENTCAPGTAPKKRRIAYLERGIGSSILRSIAEQYHGSYTSAREGDVNHSVLVLRENDVC